MLGLTDPGDGDWARLRGLQYSSLATATVTRLAAHGLAAIATAGLLLDKVHILVIGLWLAVLTASLYYGARIDASLVDADRRRMSRDEVNRQTMSSIVNALAWVAPIAFFGPFVDAQTHLKIWTVLAMLMTASAVLLPAVPLGTLMFAGIVGGAAVVNFLGIGSFDMAFVALAFVTTIGLGATEAARRYLLTKIAEATLNEKNEVVSLLLREFEEGEADWLWQIDTSRRVRSISPRFAYALGKDLRDIDGMPFIQLIAGSAWETGQFPSSLHDLAERLKRRESFSNLLVRVAIDGQQRWWELSGTPKLDENGVFDGFRGVGSDVTQQRESSDKIAYLARYDTLTGLPNRALFEDRLRRSLAAVSRDERKIGLLYIDLDRFKTVNDTFGHPCGDELVRQTAARLLSSVRQVDTVARLGGDEFAVIVFDIKSVRTAEELCERLLGELGRPFDLMGNQVYVGASIGVAISHGAGTDPADLLRRADIALYEAKKNGGGRHATFAGDMDDLIERKRMIESDLRAALAGGGGIRLFYQPIYAPDCRTVVGAEALVRWDHPVHGELSPAHFVAIAEERGMTSLLGDWVLSEVAGFATTADLPWIAFNVSPLQLRDAGFADHVLGVLRAAGVPPARIQIEIVESALLENSQTTRAVLSALRGAGIRIALDDFGTGYSSINYLKRHIIDKLKIDRSFVRTLGTAEGRAIVRAIVELAAALKVKVTAEGVETPEQRDLLVKMGCDELQGFLLSPPLEGREIQALATARPERRRSASAG